MNAMCLCRRQACLKSLHAILKNKWVRLDPLLADIKEDLLTMLVSLRVGGTQARISGPERPTKSQCCSESDQYNRVLFTYS